MNKLSQIDIGAQFKSPFNNSVGTGKTLGDAVSLGLNVSLLLGGLFILFFIVLAGFKMIQSAGSGNAQDAEKAKQAITSALIGFVIIFTAFWIILILEAITGYTFITKPF